MQEQLSSWAAGQCPGLTGTICRRGRGIQELQGVWLELASSKPRSHPGNLNTAPEPALSRQCLVQCRMLPLLPGCAQGWSRQPLEREPHLE